MPSANEIRQHFIDFFVEKHGHTFVPSSSVVPLDDPTLLFTNAGMNQFKDVFLGLGSRPYRRAVNTQKCIRAGGKHNDLDDVGKDTYHHTFFEMLGNWSFGDYFKREAIAWAWELLTKEWKIDKSRLHATVFEGDPEQGLAADDEAAELWRSVTDIDPSHIHKGNKKDNFWEMGETGPCGPCTEIHIDRTKDGSGGPLVNKGSAEVIEIWNLVFIQFNRGPDRKLTPLPAKHVDTGMGFERLTSVLQNKSSNYDTDIFAPIFEAIRSVTGAAGYTAKLEDLKDTAYRVVADHLRTLTFAITDGGEPGNEGRNYVLRRVLRRAERYGRQYLGATKPFLCDLVPAVVAVMGDAFPELKKNPQRVVDILRVEEESFVRTLDRGIRLFQDASVRAKQAGAGKISGNDAFLLHDTYGLYIDITEQMAQEAGLEVDRPAYEQLMQEARRKARGARKGFAVSAIEGELPPTDDSLKYQGFPAAEGKVAGWITNNRVHTDGRISEGTETGLILDRTNFYAEQGGQIGDAGLVSTATGIFEVEDTQKLGESVVHLGRVMKGWIEAGQPAKLRIDSVRLATMKNHTATHLLNWALRRVLGPHIEQKGSLVDSEKTRFDFSHNQPIKEEELREIEKLVNEKIYGDLAVHAQIMPLAEAKKIAGVRAVFGEKYPDPVRVLMIGAEDPVTATVENSVEFCGGTHLERTGAAGFFKIVSQEAVAKGVRRLTAVTGPAAVATVQRMGAVLAALTSRLNCKPEELSQRVDSLLADLKKIQQQVEKGAATDLVGVVDRLLANATEVAGAKIIVGELPTAPEEQVRQQLDRLRQKAGSAVIVVGWTDDAKVQFSAAVTDDLVGRGLHAGKLVGQVAKIAGGGGGGKPTMAQAGGKEPQKLAEALETARSLAHGMLAGSA